MMRGAAPPDLPLSRRASAPRARTSRKSAATSPIRTTPRSAQSRARTSAGSAAPGTSISRGDTWQHQQSTIVAQDGVLYVQTTQQHLFAVDGRRARSSGRRTSERRPRAYAASGSERGRSTPPRATTSSMPSSWRLADRSGRGRSSLPPRRGGAPATDDEGNPIGGLAGAVLYWDGMIYVGMTGSTAGARRAAEITCSRTRSSPSTPRSACGAGTSSRSITTSGTTTT